MSLIRPISLPAVVRLRRTKAGPINKLLIIIGPTSSGKSELAVQLAKKFNGEIISADSRQIYRGMDLGTGRVDGKWTVSKIDGRQKMIQQSQFVYKKIVHHLIDFVGPKKHYSVSLFQSAAKKAILDISKRGKLPILCGGTAHWVDAVVYDHQIPNVKPNKKLRAKLEKLSAAVLFKKLMALDPARAKTIDRNNPRRLIRALEIVLTTGRPVPALTDNWQPITDNYLWIGIALPTKTLYKKIALRLKQRLKAGMIKEVANLHSPSSPGKERMSRSDRRGRTRGLSWRRLESFGLEYRYVSLYLQKKLTYEEMFEQLLYAIKHYSKRQLTWWKRNKEIKWIKPSLKQATKLIKSFLLAP